MPRVVIAPNPFKGSLGAPAAARAMAAGVRDVLPDAEIRELPVADGGEGTVEALVAALDGELQEVEVEGPLGDPVVAVYGTADQGRLAIVELAASSGLPLVPRESLDPRRASTYGFGQVLEAARRRGARRILAGIGGSATNDAGAGMAQALGYRLLDAKGRQLPRGGAALARLRQIDASAVDPGWASMVVEVAVDVTNPLTGPQGATAVYGPQKGGTGTVLMELEDALVHFAGFLPPGLAETPGAGAAGGAGAGLLFFLHARLRRGAPLVAEAAGLRSALAGANLVLTGEGRVDGQTVFGKGPIEVAHYAAEAGVPVALLAGTLGPGWPVVLEEGVTLVEEVSAGVPLDQAMREAPALLRAAAARAVAALGV